MELLVDRVCHLTGLLRAGARSCLSHGGFDVISSIVPIAVFVLVVIVVAVLAAGAGYISARGRIAVAEEAARQERQQAERTRGELDTAVNRVELLQQQLQQSAATEAGLKEAVRQEGQQSERTRAELDDAATRIEGLQQQLQQSESARAGLVAQLSAEQQRGTEQVELLRDVKQDMQQTVTLMAENVLKRSGTELIKRFTEMSDHKAQATAGDRHPPGYVYSGEITRAAMSSGETEGAWMYSRWGNRSIHSHRVAGFNS
ncbi:hypothetical protein ACIRRA_44780 [Nocardia sp. NPDC101769]|uniref:hypothetical protein n=1 Tax=Nocardia sp. NPDC101769 TaxID=3364333 RepID=UPI0037FDA55A